MVAVKRAIDVVGANVGDRHDLDKAGRDGAQQHATFVAGADHTDPQRAADGFVVAKIHGAVPQTVPVVMPPFEEVATRVADRAVEILFADRFLFRSEIHRPCLSAEENGRTTR